MSYFIIFIEYLRYIVIFLQPFLVFITSCVTIWLLWRTWPKKIKADTTASNESIIVNWSGHPLPDASWIKGIKVWTPQAPPYFNTESWQHLEDCVQKMIKNLPQDIQLRLLKGDSDVIIVVPQLAAGLTILLAVLHGIMGGFPTVTCPLRKGNENNYQLPAPINLAKVRLLSREKREM